MPDQFTLQICPDEKTARALSQQELVPKSIADSMLYALAICEDDTISLTIFEPDNGASINLNKEFAKGLVDDLNHYIQKLI